jgi:beta-lactamase superfamily II metal-dependent hydrolase
MDGLIKVHMLPAEEGDFIWIEYGDEKKYSHILIDGGVSVTGNVYAKIVQEIYERSEDIEAIILTHIDYDHIQGVMDGMEQLSKEILTKVVKRIMFNTSQGIVHNRKMKTKENSFWEDNIKINTSTFGYGIGEAISLIKLLKEKELTKYLIDYVEAGDLFDLDKGAKMKIISPSSCELDELLVKWEVYKKDEEPVAYATNAENTKKNIDDLMKDALYIDNSVNNRSSIAFLFEFEGMKLVFLGDALPSVCIKGLKKHDIKEPYSVDLIKISHHGSRSNTSDIFLKFLPTENYLLSTNGNNGKVPSKVVLAHLLKNCNNKSIKLYCNYKWWELEYAGKFFTEIDKEKILDKKKLEVQYIESKGIEVKAGIKLYGRYRSNK